MLRRLSTLLSAVSLVLCVATCVLWVRSYFRYDRFSANTELDRLVRYTHVTVDSYTGCLSIAVTRWHTEQIAAGSPESKASIRHMISEAISPGTRGMWLSDIGLFGQRCFAWEQDARQSMEWAYSQGALTFPYWCPWLATLPCWVIPVWRGVRKRRTRRKGLCLACGYDLRATPDRCPECGRGAAGESGHDPIRP